MPAQRKVIVVGLLVGLLVGRLSVSRLVSRSVYPHVFSQTVSVVDTKRGYVGLCNGCSAQQEFGAVLLKNSIFTAGT